MALPPAEATATLAPFSVTVLSGRSASSVSVLAPSLVAVMVAHLSLAAAVFTASAATLVRLSW